MKTREELQDRIDQLEQLLGLQDAPPPIGIAPLPGKLLGLMMRRQFVTIQCAYDALFGAKVEPPSDQAVRGTMKRLRVALAPYGVEIKNKHGEGYYIEPLHKQKVLDLWPQLKRAA